MVAESVLHLSVIPLSLALFVRFILMMSQEMELAGILKLTKTPK